MYYLELFSNLAILRVKTRNETVNLPAGITDVIALAQTKNNGSIGIVATLQQDQALSIGDHIIVDGLAGTLLKLDSNFVDIQVNNKNSSIRRIYNPKEVRSFGYYTKNYKLIKHPSSTAMITGILPYINWEPTYTIILSQDPNIILKLLLTAQIRIDLNNERSFLPFEVDHLIFNTKPVLRQVNGEINLRAIQNDSIHLQDAITYSQNEPINLQEAITYSRNEPTVITSELSFPLQEINNISTPRVYFLNLQNNAKPIYGHVLDVNDFFPTGPARIHNNDFSFLGFSTLEPIGKRINLKIGLEEKLLANTLVETRSLSTDEGQNRQEINFNSVIDSNFKHTVTLIAEMEIFGTLISSDPIVNERLGNKLIWYYQINPGSNVISGVILVEY